MDLYRILWHILCYEKLKNTFYTHYLVAVLLEWFASQCKLPITDNLVHLAAVEYSYATRLAWSEGFLCLYNPVQIWRMEFPVAVFAGCSSVTECARCAAAVVDWLIEQGLTSTKQL